MKKYILHKGCLLLLALVFTGTAMAGNDKQKLDSLLALRYTSYNYAVVINQIEKLDKPQADKIALSVNFVNSTPSYWPMRMNYIYGMQVLQYKQLEGYGLMVEEDWLLYHKIGTTYPGTLQMEDIRVVPAKPVIYLYPEREMDIKVNLKFESEELYTWPQVDDKLGWNVTAQPDGMLKDKAGEEYPYLFWESVTTDYKWVDFSAGFVVSADNSESFLREKLKYLGLNSKEYTDFITYWAPKLRKNKFNLIRFETAAYDKAMPITVDPAPASMQRVFMVYKALDTPVELLEQKLVPFTRKGYTVIEWGGMIMPSIVN
jgi:hypothetical protein